MGTVEEFTPSPDDPLGPEHAAVSRWVRDAVQSVGADQWSNDVDLKTVDGGRFLLDAPPELARKLIWAAVAQTQYWDEQMAQIRAGAQTDMARMNPHLNPSWIRLWTPFRHTVSAIAALGSTFVFTPATSHVDLSTNEIRFRVNYRFDWAGPVAAKY